MEMNEMNLNEMEKVSVGRGGYAKKPAPRFGCDLYQIKKNDTLIRIAKRYGVTWRDLKEMNADVIKNANDITDGYWIYVPGPHA